MSFGVGVGIGHHHQHALILSAFPLQAETQAIAAAHTTTPSARRQKSIDRTVRRLKNAGIWSILIGLYLPATTEANWLVNWKTPGTYNLVKVGSPVFTANDGFVPTTVANYYDTQIPLTTLSQNNFSVGVYSKSGTSVSDCVLGAQDASGNGITINTKNASGVFVGRLMSGVFTSALSTVYNGMGWLGITRTASNSVRIMHQSVVTETTSTASVTPTSSPTIRIGGAAGNSNSTSRKLSAAYATSQALTQAQEQELHAALLDYIDRCQYGDIDIYEAGYTPQVVTADVVIYGTSMAAVTAAIRAKSQGKTVAVIGEPYVKTEWDIGGMPPAGLGFVDVATYTTTNGIFRAMISWINTAIYAGRTDANNQTGQSVEARQWRQAIRRALDTTTAATGLPQQDIPFYFSTGIKTVVKAGTVIQSITTWDGRTFLGKEYIGADYEGQMVPLVGAPYIIGTEAAGSNGEALNGFSTANIALPGASANISIDPYVTPATPASGLLPDIVAMPSITNGQPDPGLQAMNYRLAMTSDPARMAPLDSSAPPNYNAQRYEIFGRWYAADSTVRLTNDQLLKISTIFGTQYFDVNNGTGGVSTDLAQSGVNYAATLSDAARKAIIADLRDYERGFFYWHAHSGDARIPTNLKTDFAGYGLDSTSFLDPGPDGVLFWPNRAYLRDPIWQMQNSGFVLNGTDTAAADGTTPRSTKTVGVASYFFADRHQVRKVAYDAGSGVKLYLQGALQTTGQGGTNQTSPIPLEAIVPDAAVCTNFISVTAPSMTKIAWYTARMEPTLASLGESAGMIASNAIDQSVAVQNINYSTFSTAMANLADVAVKPVLPTTN